MADSTRFASQGLEDEDDGKDSSSHGPEARYGDAVGGARVLVAVKCAVDEERRLVALV